MEEGYLKLSLVSCAVALYNASSASERVSFNNLNRKTGNRLKQNLVDSVTGEPVDTADRVKGYQVSKGQYVMVEDERDRGAQAREHKRRSRSRPSCRPSEDRRDLYRQPLLSRTRRQGRRGGVRASSARP